MRNIQVTKEQSEPLRLYQACFLLLASERENIRDHVLPNLSGASLCAGEHCTDITLIAQKVKGCSILDIFAFDSAVNHLRECQKLILHVDRTRRGAVLVSPAQTLKSASARAE